MKAKWVRSSRIKFGANGRRRQTLKKVAYGREINNESEVGEYSG